MVSELSLLSIYIYIYMVQIELTLLCKKDPFAIAMEVLLAMVFYTFFTRYNYLYDGMW